MARARYSAAMPKVAPTMHAHAATSPGWEIVVTVTSWPRPATVDTVEAKPITTAGVVDSSGTHDACTISALPTPTATAVARRLPPSKCEAYKLAVAMITPTMFELTERTQPETPPPTKTNEPHARNTTQIGTVTTSAVNATARPPRTPMLTVRAERESIELPFWQMPHVRARTFWRRRSHQR